MSQRFFKYYRIIVFAFLSILLTNCSGGDNDTSESGGGETANNEFKTQRFTIVTLSSKTTASADATYNWTSETVSSENYSLANTTSKEALFAAAAEGTYKFKVEITDKGTTQEQQVTVVVTAETKELKNYISKVFEFKPAPGQFINDLPAANDGDTAERILTRANSYLAKKSGDLISLGAFGGYVVFGFDHSIVNIKGIRDFRVLGNAFWAGANPNPNAEFRGGSSEAGVIMVSYDKNKNGLPDDEWYEIEGGGHKMEKTIRNYEITYHRPDPNKIPVPGGGTGTVLFTDMEYIYWKDNQGKEGYLAQNNAYNHSLEYWPKWLKDQATITFKGTRLPDNAVDESGNGSYFVQYAFLYGYADNAPNNDDDSAIDIDWAIDSNGKKVQLPAIDFVKVYNGLNQQAGWLGETSTEIMGATDLHLSGENIPTR
ncbi:cell surface protein [Flavobacterium sp. ANB]|uniref:cell surface protein n=1 Tax=unclassified Flavobacterium TaxID=196869 RepID=UPI0012B90FC3|nr:MULTISPECIES: cell surface protein [unclassified Flavobacterium]MBF4515776.1 cell surface protein [Flavobacterium sp. ANB]MTD68779.1 cell surface protein [Flavobacterium sp. LC2016-13]